MLGGSNVARWLRITPKLVVIATVLRTVLFRLAAIPVHPTHSTASVLRQLITSRPRIIIVITACATALLLIVAGAACWHSIGCTVFSILAKSDCNAFWRRAKFEPAHTIHRVLRTLIVSIIHKGNPLSVFVACKSHFNAPCKALEQRVQLLFCNVLRNIAHIQTHI